MIANDRGRRSKFRGKLAGACALIGAGTLAFPAGALAQKAGRDTAPQAAKSAPAGDQPVIRQVRTLVSPNEPIALVNGKPITRQQLADACISRRGEEILETLIARELIEQEMAKCKVKVTPAEVDAEIERVAQTVAHVSKEQWLAALADKKKISPSQYAHDIIYPSLALKKLTADSVRVTDDEINEALESYYGEKLRCRIIMFNNMNIAKQTWEDLKRTPGAWDKLVAERSIDQATRSVGGVLTEPIARHAEPRNVSDAAFRELVDIDPAIKNDDPAELKKYQPKNGDITGVIQVTEGSWVIMRREGVEPARKFDGKDKLLAEQFRRTLFDAKVEAEVQTFYGELLRRAAVENHLTGDTKLANEEQSPDHRVDGDVQRMSNPEAGMPAAQKPAGSPAGRAKVGAAPIGVDPADVKGAEKLRKPTGN